MFQKLKKNNQKGFTLIELMIVIAIIGILAAIAIPNFIAYRNKSFCSRAESDANGVAAAVADYFAIPSHVNTPTIAQLNNNAGYTFSGRGGSQNSGTVDGADPTVNITVSVTDGSGRCPTGYQTAQVTDAGSSDGWIVGATYIYYKYVTR